MFDYHLAFPTLQAFNARIDREFEASPQTGLAVYPEGHRSTDGKSLPLKRGMLHYAYSRKLPTQVVIGANKEAILSEKHQTSRFHQTVAVGYSEVIMPADYADFEAYVAKVQSTWDATWNTVYEAEWEGEQYSICTLFAMLQSCCMPSPVVY